MCLTSAAIAEQAEIDTRTLQSLNVENCIQLQDSGTKQQLEQAVRNKVLDKYSFVIPVTDSVAIFDCGFYYVFYSFLPPETKELRFGGNIYSLILKPKILIFTYIQP